MKVWLDAQLPPSIARWLGQEHGIEATAVRDLGLRDSTDAEIFAAAGSEGVTVFSKDRDFAELVVRNGPPPQVVWITCGNVTNAALIAFLEETLSPALELIRNGEPLVRLVQLPRRD